MGKILTAVVVVLSVISLGVALTRGPESSEQIVLPPDPPPPRFEANTDYEERLQSLETEITRLYQRIESLERGAPAQPGQPQPPASNDLLSRQLAALRSDVDALLTGGDPTQNEVGRARLKDIVRSMQDEVFSDRAHDRMARHEQGRAERLKKFTSDARLDSRQEQELNRLLNDEAKKREESMQARRDGRGGQGGPSMREQNRAMREQTDAAAKSILSPNQYEQYQSMRSEDRGFGRDRGGGDRRGDMLMRRGRGQ